MKTKMKKKQQILKIKKNEWLDTDCRTLVGEHEQTLSSCTAFC